MGRKLALFVIILSAAHAFAQQSDAQKYVELLAKGEAAYRDRDYEPAAAAFREATKIAPWDGAIFAQLARAEARAEHPNAAVEAYKEAIRLGSVMAKHKANYEYQIALIYAAEENADECFKWLKSSVDSGLRSINQARSRRFRFLQDREDYQQLIGTVETDDLTRVEGMLLDLHFMDKEVRRVHYNPYRITPEDDLDKELLQLESEIPQLSDEQFYVRMRQYMRLFGDGHTNLRLGDWDELSETTRRLPFTLYWFKEGIHVFGTEPEYEKYIGYKLVSLNGIPAEDLADEIATIVNQDNPQGSLYSIPILMNNSLILNGLGVLDGDEAEITLQEPDSDKQHELLLKFDQTEFPDIKYAFSDAGEKTPLYLQHAQDKIYWYKVLPQESAIYLQYNAVREQSDEPMEQFMAEVMAKIDELKIQKLIIDVRFNGGGNSFLNANILRPVMSHPDINQEGHLFVIIGRQTFSAAQNFSSDLMRDSEAIFVGEPSGSAPQFVGETVTSNLPYTKMRISISDLFWQRGWPMDHRIWIPPDLPAQLGVKDYLNNHDPALQAALDYKLKK